MIFSRQMHAAALATGLSVWLARRRPARRIIMMHGVGGVDMPVSAFERNLIWLAARFDIVPLGEMAESIAQGRPPGRRGELSLTFDDGLRNQYEAAYPVLKRLGLPATFFVCPQLIEDRRWIWNQEVRSRLQVMAPEARMEFARQCGALDSGVEALVQRMKCQPIAERQFDEARLRELTPQFKPSELAHQRYDPLSWEDIERLDSSLITIGSHTLSHPILPSIDDETLERELAGSRHVLEQRVKRSVDLFCYPNGAQDDRVHAAVQRIYKAAVTTQYGLVVPPADVHRLKRIPAAASLPLLAWRMHRPNA